MRKLSAGAAFCPSGLLHGTSSEVVVWVPHPSGVFRIERGPWKRSSLTSSIGNRGSSSRLRVSRPVTGSASIRAGSLATMPVVGSSIIT